MASATEIYTIELKVKGDKALRELQAATNKLNITAKQTQASVAKMGRQMDVASAAAKRLGAAFLVTFGVDAIKQSLETADAIAKSAAAANLATDAYQKYTFSAEQAGVSQEKFSKSMITFNKATQDAADGLQEQKRSFDRLGVSVTDVTGEIRKTEDVFLDVVKSMALMEGGATKTRIAATLLSKAGPQLAAAMDGTADGFLAVAKSADAAAQVIEVSTLVETQRINDEFNAISREIRNKLIPVFVDLGAAALEFSKSFNEGTDELVVFINHVSNAVKQGARLLRSLELITLGSEKTRDEINLLGGALKITAGGQTRRALQTMADWFGDILPDSVSDGVTNIIRYYGDWTDETEIATKLIKGYQADVNKTIEETAQKLREATQASVAYKNEFAKIGVVYSALATKSDNLNFVDNSKAAATAARDYAREQEKVIQSILRIENYRKRFAEQERAWIEEQAALMEEIRKKAEDDWRRLGEQVGEVFANFAGDVISGTKSAKEAFEDFVRDMIKLIAKLIAQYAALQIAQAATGGGGFSIPGLNATAANAGAGIAGAVAATFTPPSAIPMTIGNQRVTVGNDNNASAGGVSVTVNNNVSNAAVSVSEDTNGNAVINIDDVRKAVAADLQRGGTDISRAMEGAYRVSRAGSAFQV